MIDCFIDRLIGLSVGRPLRWPGERWRCPADNGARGPSLTQQTFGGGGEAGGGGFPPILSLQLFHTQQKIYEISPLEKRELETWAAELNQYIFDLLYIYSGENL
jgi:hypothetical protein